MIESGFPTPTGAHRDGDRLVRGHEPGPAAGHGAVGIPPIVVFASVLIGSKVAGVPGAIFGLPIAAVISAVFMFSLRRSLPDQGSVAVRAAQRLAAREGRHVRVPREPDPTADASPE